MPATPADNKSPTPETLSKRFNLEAKGRDNGEAGEPAQDYSGLDKVEIQVEGHCRSLLDERIQNYHKEINVLEERVDKRFVLSVSPDETVRDRDGNSAEMDTDVSDPHTETACRDLENVITDEGSELKLLRRKAQAAIYELNNFRKEHQLDRDPTVPDSLLQSLGILGIAIAIETVLNGFFFGANVAGGLVQGVGIALLISAVNVIVFGFLGAATYRQIAHRVDLRKFAGILGFIAVILFALGFNFAVAHYRDALPPDYPPETLSAEATEAERQIAECRRGDSDIEASQEALCLVATRTYRLDGFMSYLLLLIGLAACAFGAWEWSRMTDPYSGYGKLGRNHRKTEDELEEQRREVQERLASKWTALQEKQESAFDDPVERFNQTDGAIKKRVKLHNDLLAYSTNLEESCGGAIKIYQDANQNARKDPQSIPSHWNERWKANWKIPGEPPLLSIHPFKQAISQKQREQAILNKQLRAINTCFDKCKKEVEDMTRLKHA